MNIAKERFQRVRQTFQVGYNAIAQALGKLLHPNVDLPTTDGANFTSLYGLLKSFGVQNIEWMRPYVAAPKPKKADPASAKDEVEKPTPKRTDQIITPASFNQ